MAGRPGRRPAAARAAFAKAPLDRVRATWRADTEHELRTDPVATGAVSLLVGGTALTLAVALAALVLLVVTARFDDAAELYAWEADGVPPRTLRMALWWRAAAVAALAVPTGVVAGLVLDAAGGPAGERDRRREGSAAAARRGDWARAPRCSSS